jgi:hypothetical protein
VVTGLVQDDRNVAWVEVNGKRLGKKRGISVEKKTKAQLPFEETIKLAPGETKITVRAADEAGNVSEYAIPVVRGPVTTAAVPAPATVAVAPAARPGLMDRLRGRLSGNKVPAAGTGTTATGPAAPAGARPDLYVLSIGVSRYKSGGMSLQFADNDATKLAEVFRGQEGKLYGRVFTKVLVNEGVTRDTILEAVVKFLGQASDFDVAMVFVAGHGVQDRVTGSYYYLPYDATPENIMSHGLRWSDFDESVTKLRTHVSKVVLFVDTCHAGSMTVAMRGAEAGEDLAKTLKEAEGTFIVSASKAGETSEERDEWRLPGETRGHGAFTLSILKGLLGGADVDRSGSVSLDELSYYVGKEVPRMTGGNQHPYKRSAGTDMPMAVTPGTVGK